MRLNVLLVSFGLYRSGSAIHQNEQSSGTFTYSTGGSVGSVGSVNTQYVQQPSASYSVSSGSQGYTYSQPAASNVAYTTGGQSYSTGGQSMMYAPQSSVSQSYSTGTSLVLGAWKKYQMIPIWQYLNLFYQILCHFFFEK